MKSSRFLLAATAVMLGATTALAAGGDGGAKAPAGVDRANLDTTVSPGQDFYQYACGGWMANNPLGAEYSRFGTFDQLGELNRQQVRDLIDGLSAADNAPGTNAQKIADLYRLGMDAKALNQQGSSPVMADLARINALTRQDIMPLLATLPGADSFFGTGVEADMMNSDVNAMYWGQGGLGLGERDYYLEDDARSQDVRKAYVKFLTEVARLSGYSTKDARRLAQNTMDIETALARAAMSREELRDPMASYNPMTAQELAQKYPNVDLKAYFAAQGLQDVPTVIIGQPKSLAAVDSILANAPEQALRDYVAAGYLGSAAPYLSDKYYDAAFGLSRVISGVDQPQPRWKRALGVPNGMLGEALGELYVQKYFPATSKAMMTDLVDNLRVALAEHITQLPWMTAKTKNKALQKLANITVKIGYPDAWRDYSALTIDPAKPYWNNVQEAILFNNQYNLSDYGKPVEKARWGMTPQTVNAYYNPLSNEICFPAGILQKPFFYPEAPMADNYGAIGVVIGHEMTHGFDDQGRQFDKDGNLSNWWTQEDTDSFNRLADGLVAQFDAVEVLSDPSTHANGRFTLGENIADQGGLRVAHTAFHNALDQNPQQNVEMDGFTPDQRFYLGYANVWAANIRPAEILQRTKTDPHSLGRWRVNASLRNIEPFFEAFAITDGQPMFRPAQERVVIW